MEVVTIVLDQPAATVSLVVVAGSQGQSTRGDSQ